MTASSKPGGRGTPGRPNAHQTAFADGSSALASEINDILGLGDLGLADVGFNHTSWRFYDSTLSDTTGTYTFGITRTTSKTRIGTDGYLDTITSGNPAYTAAAGGGSILGIHAEEARTNLLTYSRDMSAGWGLTRLTASDDSSVAHIDGGDARKFTVNGVGGTCRAENLNVTVTSAAHYVLSIWVKYGSLTANASRLRFDQTTDSDINITWTAGVPSIGSSSNVNASDVEAHIDDWYRIWLNVTADTTTVNAIFYPDYGTTTTNDYMYFGGAQLELVPYTDSKPSSYILTTSAAVSRNKDVPAMTTFDAALKATLGDDHTLWIKALRQGGDTPSASMVYFYIGDATSTSYESLYRYTGNDIGWALNNGTDSAAANGNLSSSELGRMIAHAANYEDGNALFDADGGDFTATDATAGAPVSTNYDRLRIGNNYDSGLPPESLIVSEFRIYPAAKTAVELAALTA